MLDVQLGQSSRDVAQVGQASWVFEVFDNVRIVVVQEEPTKDELGMPSLSDDDFFELVAILAVRIVGVVLGEPPTAFDEVLFEIEILPSCRQSLLKRFPIA